MNNLVNKLKYVALPRENVLLKMAKQQSDIFLTDRLRVYTKNVVSVTSTVLAKALTHDNRDNRFEFYEVMIDESEEVLK